ncbi:ankyrin repeat-containing protein ITN1-like [Syzygium oleosum]|uniref:ankyrin repeat-containing protein ITN1-like n=1 Tax=Syzygium oleosum TaxID=219896 RepID=UPI0011D18D55|nr:ankyrin repeat-containing protein ITN1-like [Syzygium oleosum]
MASAATEGFHRDIESGVLPPPNSGTTGQFDQSLTKNKAMPRKSTELHSAAEQDDAASVKRILLEIDSRRPIHGASTEVSVAPLKSVDEMNESGETALFVAAKKGNASIVKELLKHSTREGVMRKNIDGLTALHIASGHGHADIVQMLLDYEPELIKTAGPSNSSPLMAAATRGHAAVVDQLLARDCSLLTVLKSNGRNALHLAARLGLVEVVQSLLGKDKQLGRRSDSKGQNALHLAVKGYSQKVVKLLIEADPAVVVLPDLLGNTALHVATRKARDKIVEDLLLYPETNVNATNKDRKTALDIAEELPYSPESINITSCLSRKGASRANDLIAVKELNKALQGGINSAHSVNMAAILIAQIAFAAIFTVPSGGDSSGIPLAMSSTSVKVLIICNSIAFFASIAVVLIQVTVTRGETEPEALAMVAEVTGKLIWLATISISVVFMTAIYIVVGRQNEWASTLITVTGGVILLGSLGIKTYYEMKLRRIRSIRKKET